MMLALYAVFWLQLESASSAAVTVGTAIPIVHQGAQQIVRKLIEPYQSTSNLLRRNLSLGRKETMIWNYARERQARLERDALAAELAEKEGKSQLAVFLERIGFLGRLVTYLVLLGLLAVWYPDFEVYQKPLAGVTAGGLIYPLWWLGICFVVLWALFNPRKHPQIKKAWGIWTICLGVVAVVLPTYLRWI
jgi:hypothetical protein